MIRAALAALLSLAAFPAASDFLLYNPVDCVVGDTCYIQHLPDRDPGPGSQDFTCGNLTYDGHKGTDFALPSLTAMADGVEVRAASDGVVTGTRDGVPDRLLTPDTAQDVAGKECGNGVVLRHEDGWETQYCHMRQGSIRVQTGDTVIAGQTLGLIGLSGKTQFPHLHLSVRHNGEQVDPFAPTSATCGGTGSTLWVEPPPVSPGGIISAGFAAGVPEYQTIKAGAAHRETLATTAPALVLYGFAYGSRSGDTLRLSIDGPEGAFLDQTVELTKPQAQFFRASGRRLTAPSWPPGTYTGTVTLLRNGASIDSKVTSVEIRSR